MADKNSSKFINSTLIVALLLAVFLWSTVSHNAQSDTSTSAVEVDFLDVGQGDAILIKLPESKQILVDGGREGTVLERLKSEMPPFDKKIEYVVASHPDADHIGGLVPVLQNYSVGEFFESGKTSESATFNKLENLIGEKKISKKQVRAGDKIDLGSGSDLNFLWPDENAAKTATTNNASVVARFDYESGKILFTGDAEVDSQNQMMARYKAGELRADILKVPHHGASSAYNKKFLEEVGAKFAVISVGKNNNYGHPTQIILSALESLGAKILRTDELGTIEFSWSGGSWVKK